MTAKRYLSPPERCERLCELAPRFGGTIDLRSERAAVSYALPASATNELREFWEREATVTYESEYLARLPQGRVFGSGIVLAPDGKSIARDVSPDFGKSFEDHWLLSFEKMGQPRFIADSVAVTASTMATGYSHWLLDELPRLLALRANETETLIAHTGLACMRFALKQQGWTGTVIASNRKAHYQCEQLIVPSFDCTVSYPTRRGLDRIMEFTSTMRSAASSFGERLFVTRENARRRKIVNERELWAELEAYGFAKIRLEELTWPEQIEAFRRAKVVVAAHGAGLANIAFCQPASIVVELFNRSYVNGCFWRLATLRGLDYRPVVPKSAKPLAQTSSSNRLDIVAAIPQVRAALR